MTSPGSFRGRTGEGFGPALELPGVLTAEQVAATVRGIAAIQGADGSIPWFTGGHLDPWDHVESAMALDAAGEHTKAAAAYRWLAQNQNGDGSWFSAYTEGQPTDRTREANFSAYIAVGAWHHHLATGDSAFLDLIWPSVYRAVEFVLDLQAPGGHIRWKRDPDGSVPDEALLTGSSSMYQALRCALAIAEHRERQQPDWELATGRLAHVIRHHPERFLDKDRYSMDWYYPVLGTALRGTAAQHRIAAHWERFVVPGLGVRCVADRPWVTGGESAELALALGAMGRRREAVDILRWIQRLRDADGMYWTGYVFDDDAFWPQERTSWTAGALLLAVAALAGHPATIAVFGGRLPVGLAAEATGCDADSDTCR